MIAAMAPAEAVGKDKENVCHLTLDGPVLEVGVPIGFIADMCAPKGRSIKSIVSAADSHNWETSMQAEEVVGRWMVTPKEKARDSNAIFRMDNGDRIEVRFRRIEGNQVHARSLAN